MTQMPLVEYGAETTPARVNLLLAFIPRFKWVFFAIVAALIVLSFNGRWRIGRDSAAYRGLAHQLATTGHYVFRDKQDLAVYSDQQDTRYPGMPLILAGMEKLFGRGDTAAVIPVMLMAIGTLLLTYRLLAPAVPLWLAIAVTFGVGINGRFLEHANEVLTDVPFLFGVVITLLAFDRLQRARETRGRAGALALLVIGLLLAAALRPTFWVLALALLGACAWGIFKPTHAGQGPDDARPRRTACLMTLGVLLLAAVTFLLLIDVRGKTASGYEGKMINRLVEFREKVLAPLPQNAYELLEQTLPESFFGTQLGPGFIPFGARHWLGLSTVFSLIVIASAVWLVRRNVLWGLFALLTVITMSSVGSVPRYFIMILPLLLTGWGLCVARAAERFRFPWGREIVTFIGLGAVVVPNLISSANLIREQRGFSRPQDGLKHVGFAKAYHSGKWAGVHEVAKMVHDHVSPDQKVIGPEATVLTFLSERNVFGLSAFLPRKDRNGVWSRRLRDIRKRFTYAVFPDTSDKLYDDKDVVTGKLIRTRVIRPTTTIATAGGYKLCEYEIVTKRSKAKHTRDLTAATQPKRKRRPPATGATTRSSTLPTTSPVRRRPRPATAPTTRPATRPAGAADVLEGRSMEVSFGQPSSPISLRPTQCANTPLPSTVSSV